MDKIKYPQIYNSLTERVLAHTIILPWSGCYIYMGYLNRGGYGEITVRSRINGKFVKLYVHRAMWKEANPHIILPKGREYPLRHTCHVPCCWRPDHLIPGTRKQNVADTLKRGTHVSGWRLHNERKRQEKHIHSIVAEGKEK